jgi:hypothetical protein
LQFSVAVLPLTARSEGIIKVYCALVCRRKPSSGIGMLFLLAMPMTRGGMLRDVAGTGLTIDYFEAEHIGKVLDNSSRNATAIVCSGTTRPIPG